MNSTAHNPFTTRFMKASFTWLVGGRWLVDWFVVEEGWSVSAAADNDQPPTTNH
jgi:hypothetical protein